MESATYTRAMLQSRSRNNDSSANQTKEHAIQKRVDAIVSHVVQHVLRFAEEGRKNYLLDSTAPSMENLQPMLYFRPSPPDPTDRRYEVNVLPVVVAQLQRLFPDCDILINPLQTYVFVDWS